MESKQIKIYVPNKNLCNYLCTQELNSLFCIVLWQAILQDLFPGVEIPEHDYGRFQVEIVKVQGDFKLQVVESQIMKVIQLYETMIVRHGVMLVGPTGSGKTTVYKVQ